MTTERHLLTRRTLLRSGALATGALALGPTFWKRAVAAAATVTDGPYGPLGAPDANGIRLPAGFTSRKVLEANEIVGVGPGAYRFPIFPDGQATYATPDGGFILVTNSESAPPDAGTSAARFDADGELVEAYRILGETRNNCAGGPTPWGTWLSCEEFDDEGEGALAGRGAVWQCDPTKPSQGVRLPALGLFSHEAVAVDSVGQRLYLTEDDGNGCLYRFTPTAYPMLDDGVLEVLVGEDGGVATWVEVPDPQPGPGEDATRDQVPQAKRFQRGEGIWFDSGVIYVATTSDSRLYAYDTRTQVLEVIYQGENDGQPNGPLTDVDNITVSPSGDLFACEDSGGEDGPDIALLTPDLTISRFLRLDSGPGAIHAGSEATGPIFDPSGTRFFFTSQRAQTPLGPFGAVYEITGPFRLDRPTSGPTRPGGPTSNASGSNTETVAQGGTPRETGQTAGSGQAASLVAAPLVGPALGVELPRRLTLAAARGRGFPLALTLDEPATVSVVVRAVFQPAGTRNGRRRPRRTYRLGSARRSYSASGPRTLSIPLTREARALLVGRRTNLRVVAEVTITDRRGRRSSLDRTVLLKPR